MGFTAQPRSESQSRQGRLVGIFGLGSCGTTAGVYWSSRASLWARHLDPPSGLGLDPVGHSFLPRLGSLTLMAFMIGWLPRATCPSNKALEQTGSDANGLNGPCSSTPCWAGEGCLDDA